MKRLELTDDLLTGIDEVDSQHRELFARGNRVLFPEGGKASAADILKSLLFLMHYVDEHFEAEERLMRYHEFDRLEGHRRQHQRLRRDVEELYRRTDKGGGFAGLASDLHYLFGDWYVYHIKEWDRKFALFLRNRPLFDDLLISGLDQVDVSEVEILKTGDDLTPAQLRTLKKLRPE